MKRSRGGSAVSTRPSWRGGLWLGALALGGGLACNAILDNPEGQLVPSTGAGGTDAAGNGGTGGSSAGGGKGGTSGSTGQGGEGADAGSAGEVGAAGSNGGEACSVDADCEAALPKTTPAGCAEATCDKTKKTCVFVAKDSDDDGHTAKTCSASGVKITTGDDCDDDAADVHPGAWDGPKGDSSSEPDRCDEVDQDCDGTADNAQATVDGGKKSCACDPDHPRPCYETSTGKPIDPKTVDVGICHRGTQDCNDGVPGACSGAVGPKAETCNGKDDDCDGETDNDASGSDTFCKDADGDSHCTTNCVSACDAPDGYISESSCLSKADCDDSSSGAAIHPGADEICNDGIDNNCAGGDNETFPNLGDPCVNGDYGVCRRIGTYVCSDDGLSTVCNAAVVSPAGLSQTRATDSDIDTSTARSDYDPLWDFNCDNSVTYDIGSQGIWEGIFRGRACGGSYDYACSYLNQSQCADGVLGTKYYNCDNLTMPAVCGHYLNYISCLWDWNATGRCDYVNNTFTANNQILPCE